MSYNKMAKLINVFQSAELGNLEVKRRHLPVACGEIQMLMMDLKQSMTFDEGIVTANELEVFGEKFNLLGRDEAKRSLEVNRMQFAQILRDTVPCVGCRCSVDRLFDRFMEHQALGHGTLYPILITANGTLTIHPEKIRQPAAVCALLSHSDERLNRLVENQPRNKKSSRCSQHSLDSFRQRPFIEQWLDVWNCMNQHSKNEIAVIDADELKESLDDYLKKHKFCSDCRTKVEKAYGLLMLEANPKDEDYKPKIYEGIKKCIANKHIHLKTDKEFIQALIKKAEPELSGSPFKHRERHAKSLDVAQEEVLICVGMCIYEKLRRIHVCLKEEENACRVLGAVAVSVLSRSFNMAVESKSGSKLDLYYEEMSREERLKEQRKEQKKLKKRRRRNERRNQLRPVGDECKACNNCDESVCECDEDEEEEEDEIEEGEEEEEEEEEDEISCHSCHAANSDDKAVDGVCTQASIDGGYASEHNGSCSTGSSHNNSPEGSEVACSDGLCNHEGHSPRNTPDIIHSKYCGTTTGFISLLKQMLDDSTFADDDDDGIPTEHILEYKSNRRDIQQARQELRERLSKRFNRLCVKLSAKQKKK